jgi:DNA gyrase/topoisomerase IV subunit A
MANEIIKTMNEKDFTAEEIQAFNEQYLEGMKKIAHLEHVKKSFEEQEKTIKEQLEQVCKKYGIKSIDNEYMKITYVAAGTDKQTIDIDQLAKEEPDLYSDLLKDYPKTTKGRKAYIMFKVKDKE